MFGRDLDRMMQMWAELLGEIEAMPISVPQKAQLFPRQKSIGNIEDRDEDIVLSADLPGVEVLVVAQPARAPRPDRLAQGTAPSESDAERYPRDVSAPGMTVFNIV